jgi:hypothetical protein
MAAGLTDWVQRHEHHYIAIMSEELRTMVLEIEEDRYHSEIEVCERISRAEWAEAEQSNCHVDRTRSHLTRGIG